MTPASRAGLSAGETYADELREPDLAFDYFNTAGVGFPGGRRR
jgi:hypothetical protein